MFLLVLKYEKNKDQKYRSEIKDFYLDNTENVNNWDLVDSSAHKILGDYLLNYEDNFDLLKKLAKSKDLWEQRISIIATYQYIKAYEFKPTLEISEMLLNHPHDLIHKAVGWMLREMGKRDEKVLVQFLKKHYKEMPRTMLRYAIEKFDEVARNKYLTNQI